MIIPDLESSGTSLLPKIFDTMNINTNIYAMIPTHTSAVPHAGKNIPEITGMILHMEAQGTAHTTIIVSIFCPQLSITLVPLAPPMVQPIPIRIGATALP